MAKNGRPNTTRLLDAAGVEYTLHSYEANEFLDAVSVAQKIHADPDRVFKTLIVRGDKTGVEVFCVPGSGELDLKKAAYVTSNKRVEMVRADELLALTGYIKGGCSPIGMKKPYRIHIDETAILHETVFVSAGLRGLQLEVGPEDLSVFVGSVYADVTG